MVYIVSSKYRQPAQMGLHLTGSLPLLAHSKNELMRWRGVCRLSVCLSVCVCVCKLFCYDAKNSSIATKLTQDGQQVGAHPCCAQGRGQGQRSRDTSAFVLITKIASSRRQIPDCDQTCTRWSLGQRASRMCPVSRSRDTGTFVLDLKSHFLAGK